MFTGVCICNLKEPSERLEMESINPQKFTTELAWESETRAPATEQAGNLINITQNSTKSSMCVYVCVRACAHSLIHMYTKLEVTEFIVFVWVSC